MSIDLKWRPESYGDFHDPVALALNGIQGQMRREMVRDMLTAEDEHRPRHKRCYRIVARPTRNGQRSTI